MLALFRFLICVAGATVVSLAAVRAYQGKNRGFWHMLDPRDADDFHKQYGDRSPY